MNGKSLDAFCAGFACWDLVFFVKTHPQKDEKMSTTQFIEGAGGPALTASGSIASLGGKSAFASYLGNDSFGEKCVQALNKIGVSTADILWNSQPTPIATVYVKSDGNRSVVNYKAQEPNLPLESLDTTIQNARVCLIDPHWPRLAEYVVNKSRQFNIPTIIDAGSLTPASKALSEKVDFCVCSEVYAKAITHKNDPEDLYRGLSKLYEKGIVTLGSAGSWWWDKNDNGHISAIKINPVDTTGAGDVFHGAFSLAIAQGKTLPKAAQFATIAATASCLKRGSLNGVPSINDIENLKST